MMKIQFNSTILENNSGLNNFVLSLNKDFGEMTLNEEKFKLYTEAPIKLFIKNEKIEIISFTPVITLEHVITSKKSNVDFRILLEADNFVEAIKEARENSDFHEEYKNEEDDSYLNVFGDTFEKSLLALINSSNLSEVCATSPEESINEELHEIEDEMKITPATERFFDDLEKENLLREIDKCLSAEKLNYAKLTYLSEMLNKYN